MSLFRELRRRNVFRVGAAYLVTAWLLLQVLDVATPIVDAPEWVPKAILLLLIIGFPIALLFAWAFELTPEGVKFERDVDRSLSITRSTGRKLDFIVIALLSVALVFFVVDKYAWRNGSGAGTAQAEELRSIAVLPFANMSGDPDQLYFSDGISEEILNSLVRVDGISVASRTSSFKYRDDEHSVPEIAEALGVLFVLEGSVRKSADRLRITAQLIDARNDRHLWSETYDRRLEDIFDIQTDIANSISQAIRSEIGIPVAGPIPVHAPTGNMTAYEHYLKGYQSYTQRARGEDVQASIDNLQQAVTLDPEFADAWLYLAVAYETMPYWGFRDKTFEEYFGLARQAVNRALELDPDLSFGYAVLGDIELAAPPYDLDKAYKLYQTALEKNPKNPSAHHWLGIMLGQMGYIERSIEAQKRCLELDPGYVNCLAYLRSAYYVLGDYEAANALSPRLWIEHGRDIAVEDVVALFSQGRPLAAYAAARNMQGFGTLQRLPPEALPLMIAALENPSGDHRAAFEKFAAIARESGVEWHNETALVAAFGAYDELDVQADADLWYWMPAFSRYRASDTFKRIMTEFGNVAFWQAHGFPPMCRPLGADDFSCD